MPLYRISQHENNDYDTYDSAVVCAPNEDHARNMNPTDGTPIHWSTPSSLWCSQPDAVIVEFLGEAADAVRHGIICASFNAG